MIAWNRMNDYFNKSLKKNYKNKFRYPKKFTNFPNFKLN